MCVQEDNAVSESAQVAHNVSMDERLVSFYSFYSQLACNYKHVNLFAFVIKRSFHLGSYSFILNRYVYNGNKDRFEKCALFSFCQIYKL